MSNPIVIQHTDLDEFIGEIMQEPIGIVRLWLGQFNRGGQLSESGIRHPVSVYHAVNVQAFNRSRNEILSICIVLGVVQEVAGRPFGADNEQKRRLLERSTKQAVTLVREHLEYKLEEATQPPVVKVRPGSIHTGLDARQIQIGTWWGFDDLYDRLNNVGVEREPVEDAD